MHLLYAGPEITVEITDWSGDRDVQFRLTGVDDCPKYSIAQIFSTEGRTVSSVLPFGEDFVIMLDAVCEFLKDTHGSDTDSGTIGEGICGS